MNTDELRGHHDDAVALAEAAGPIALEYFRRSIDVDDKSGGGHFDPVTAADRKIESFLRAELTARFPGYGVHGEEEGMAGAEASRRWVIDPIDGTRAFISGMPAWGILLGLVCDGTATVGVMHQPYLRETFSAIRGKGAWLRRAGNEVAVATRKRVALADATLYSTHPEMFTTKQQRDGFARVAAASRMTRYGGDCYSYCLLAMGQIDLVVEAGLQAYDILPLIPIIEAAGGVVTDVHGAVPSEGGFVVAAGDSALHAAALDVIGLAGN